MHGLFSPTQVTQVSLSRDLLIGIIESICKRSLKSILMSLLVKQVYDFILPVVHCTLHTLLKSS